MRRLQVDEGDKVRAASGAYLGAYGAAVKAVMGIRQRNR